MLKNNALKPVIFLGSCMSMHNIIESCNASHREIIGIIDNDYLDQKTLYGLPVLSDILLNDKTTTDACEFFVATGWNPEKNKIMTRNNKKRDDFIALMTSHKLVGATVIHPSAVVSPLAKIGRNVRVGALTIITAGAEIQDHTVIKEQCYISHDVVIAEDCVLQMKSTITGNVHIGKHTWVGVNSTIIRREVISGPMQIGSNVLIHPGVVVMQNLPDNSVASVLNKKFSKIF